MLSIPFEPDQRVSLIRPDTLEIVYVRCQHIVDCELTACGKSPAAVFKDPVLSEMEATKAAGANGSMLCHPANDIDLTCSDTDDEAKADSATARRADVDLVCLHNRPLHKRDRYTELESQDLLLQMRSTFLP